MFRPVIIALLDQGEKSYGANKTGAARHLPSSDRLDSLPPSLFSRHRRAFSMVKFEDANLSSCFFPPPPQSKSSEIILLVASQPDAGEVGDLKKGAPKHYRCLPLAGGRTRTMVVYKAIVMP